MKRIIFSLDDELLNTVNATCNAKGITRSEYIRAQLYKAQT